MRIDSTFAWLKHRVIRLESTVFTSAHEAEQEKAPEPCRRAN